MESDDVRFKEYEYLRKKYEFIGQVIEILDEEKIEIFFGDLGKDPNGIGYLLDCGPQNPKKGIGIPVVLPKISEFRPYTGAADVEVGDVIGIKKENVSPVALHDNFIILFATKVYIIHKKQDIINTFAINRY